MLINRRLSRWSGAATAIFFAAVLACAHAQPFGYSVRSDGDDRLYRINLSTGAATELGATGFTKIEGLALNAAGELYGVHLTTAQPAQIVKCSTASGACTLVGSTTVVSGGTAGLAFAATGQLYLATSSAIFSVNTTTGVATALSAPAGPAIAGLASGASSTNCGSGLYALAGNADAGRLYCVNTTSGALALLGTLTGLTSTTAIDGGIDGDRTTGLVWGITNPSDAAAPAEIYSIEPATLAVSALRTVTLAGAPIGGFESLAVEPSTAAVNTGPSIPTVSEYGLLFVALGLCVFGAIGMRRLNDSPRTWRALKSRR